MRYRLTYLLIFFVSIEMMPVELRTVFFLIHIAELYGNKIKLRLRLPMKYQIWHYLSKRKAPSIRGHLGTYLQLELLLSP